MPGVTTRKRVRAGGGVLVRTKDLTIRRMRDHPDDYAVMAKWLTDERVIQFYHGRDQPHGYERVLARYGPRVRGEDPVQPCILLCRGRKLGYIQYYLVQEARDYELEGATGTYAIDLFIGEPQLWGKGIGTRALSAIVRYIFEELRARRIVIDPHLDNARAIRCYEKCGFRKVKVLREHELHEGARRDAWLMVIEREADVAEAFRPSPSRLEA